MSDRSETPGERPSFVGLMNRLADHKAAIKEIQDLVINVDCELAKEIVVILKRYDLIINDRDKSNK